jgi:hypothetical protein
MSGEVVKKLLNNIPEKHRVTDDARIAWLWNQRIEVVQSIYGRTDNPRDRMAATLVIAATHVADLRSIELVLQRLEGGAVQDQELQEDDSLPI